MQVGEQVLRVGTASVVMMCLDILIGILIPIGLFFVVRKKSGGSAKAFFVGCGTFFLFATVLESLVHNLVYLSPAGQTIWNNIWLYGLYGGFMAGLFEETGRFLAFRTVLKKQRDNDGNAWTYGAGHGGFEAFFILVFSTFSTLMYAAAVNGGKYEQILGVLPDDQKETFANAIQTLVTTPAPMFLVSVGERCSAILLHMGLTLLVWIAVKKGGRKIWYFPLAILFHMAADTVMVIFNSLVQNVFLTEVLVLAEAVLVMAFALWRWRAEIKQGGGESGAPVEP